MDGPGLAGIAASTNSQTLTNGTEVWGQLTILVIALLLCAIASAAETALTSISKIKLKNLIEEEDEQATRVEPLVDQPNKFLSAILIIHSVAVIVASGMATLLALSFSQELGPFLASLVLSLVIIIFCEITPRMIVIQDPLRWANSLSGLIRGAAWLLNPLIWTFSKLTTLLVRMFGGQIRHHGSFVTAEELRLLVTVGEEEGVLEEEETEMIHSIFEFANTTVREVMVPRIDMVTLASNTTVAHAVDLAMEGGFSRIPVYDSAKDLDEIIGILYVKDMLKQLRENRGSQPVQGLVRSAYFVPETKKLDDLLREMRQNRVHMVMVVDEYGSVAGLVTIEDLVEEIVGDIKDEYDREENLYEKLNEREYIFDAKISIHEFNDIMDMELDDDDYETLGGFVYAQLDKIPNAGDVVQHENVDYTVLATRGRRITQIRVERQPQRDEENKEDEVLLLPPPTTSSPSTGPLTASEQPQQPTRFEYREV